MYGQIRTADAASNVPAGNVLTSLTLFAVVYSILLVATLYFGSRIIRHGPNLDIPIPGLDNKLAINMEPATFIPDQRPAETQL
jgi:cytochrome d ubiquinol oxidase subunit I